MFDGIAQVVVVTPRAAPALQLYRDTLGFTEAACAALEPAHAELLRLPPGPLTARLLTKEGASGGAIRLVEAPELPPVNGPRSMAVPGPFALDFYVRDLPRLYAELSARGYRFRSEPQRYTLPGFTTPVDEVLLEAPEGLVHALIQYRPEQHRCVLGARPRERVSEVVAAITVTDRIDDGLELLRDVLGGQVYFNQRFAGPAVEALIGLPPGVAFRAVLVRGPERRNARAELMATVADDPRPPMPPPVHPRVVLGCPVPDLDAVIARLPDGPDVGPLAISTPFHGDTRACAIDTGWGALLELWEATR